MSKEQKIIMLQDMETRLRLVVFLQKKVHRMLEKGLSLSNPELINTYRKLEDHLDKIIERKRIFENSTGEKIMFYLTGLNQLAN